MFRKILLTLIVMSGACIVALTIDILDAQTVERQKTEGVAEISTKPSIVALATAMKNFRASLSNELIADASFPLGHKESYSWTNTPAGRNDDRGGIGFDALSIDQLTRFYEVLNVFLSDDGLYQSFSYYKRDRSAY